MNVAITPAVMSIIEFMAWSRLGRTKVYELIGSQELRAIKSGRRTLIPVEAAKAWLEAQPVYRDAA